MARIVIDESTCVGCGLCASACPDCFEMVDTGIAKVKASKCGDCDVSEVASQCPVNAITIEE